MERVASYILPKEPADLAILFQLIVLGIIVPSVDMVSDLTLSVKLFLEGHGLWALLVLLPVIANFLFTVPAWRRWPAPPHKRSLDVAALILQVWPQYVCFTIARDMLQGKEGWQGRRESYNRNVSTLEPFIESLSQLIIKLCIWTFFNQKHQETGQNPLIDIGQGFFFFTISLSALASILGITKFFKESPFHFLPQSGFLGGIITLRYLLMFLAVLFNAGSKILLLIMMLFYSLGVISVLSSPTPGSNLVETCSSLALVYSCFDASFLVEQHNFSNDSIVSWTNESGEWRVFNRGEGWFLFWNTEEDRWTQGTAHCLENSSSTQCDGLSSLCGTNSRVYCNDFISIVTLSRLVAFLLWLLLNVVPHILLASVALMSMKTKAFIMLVIQFPELLLSPPIANITFGPRKKCQIIRLSPFLCFINIIMSILGHFLSLYLLFLHYKRADPDTKHSLDQFLREGYQSNDIDQYKFNVDWIPPYLVILFLSLSALLLFFVFNLNLSILSKHTFFLPISPQNASIVYKEMKWKIEVNSGRELNIASHDISQEENTSGHQMGNLN